MLGQVLDLSESQTVSQNFETRCVRLLLDYLTSLRKPESTDPQHNSIGTYNGRQMILLKFFRWLYQPNELDARKRVTPDCMNGIRRLPRMEKSAYKPSESYSKQNNLGRIIRDGLLKKYQQYYKKSFFPSLMEVDSVSERDKAYIRNMLMIF